MPKAIVIQQHGNSSVMQWREWALPALASGQVLIRHTAVGFNMIDTYMRRGLYPLTLPAVLGVEAAGVVEAVADGVTDLTVGDRVVYLTREPGAYSELRNVDAAQVVKLPADISDEMAAATFLKGLTCWALLKHCYEVKAGDTVLIYAAAGGLGSLLVQWAKVLGARVIGVVGSAEKVAVAKAMGCDEVINRSTESVVAAVKTITGGRGVQVVYDSLGADTFDTSLDCLAPLGTMVSFGNATGPVPPINILVLAQKGSLKLVRPQVFFYVDNRTNLEAAAQAWFELLRSDVISIPINQRFSLADAGRAHDAVESSATTGLTVLTV